MARNQGDGLSLNMDLEVDGDPGCQHGVKGEGVIKYRKEWLLWL